MGLREQSSDDRDEDIAQFLGELIEDGIWPYPGAVKVIGGAEVVRRAIRAMDEDASRG